MEETTTNDHDETSTTKQNHNNNKTLEEIKAEARRYALATTKNPRAPYAPTFLAPPPQQQPETSKPSATTNHSIDDDDYLQFVLGLNDTKDKLLEDDDDEFQLDPLEEDLDDDEEEEEDEIDEEEETKESSQLSIPLGSPDVTKHLNLDHDDDDMDWDIHQELGWLQEDDDMDLTLTNLVNDETKMLQTENLQQPKKQQHNEDDELDIQWIDKLSGLANTQQDRTNPPIPTALQQEKLRSLLKRHYQLLIQQAIMAVRMAHADKRKQKGLTTTTNNNHKPPNVPERTVVIETADDLIEIVDSAVGKLIDLRQQRQDSFRSILAPQQDTLLTRAQFRKVKETVEGLHTMTLFDVHGLDELDDTFSSIDQSVHGLTVDNNILWMDKHADACRKIFKDRKLEYIEDLVPGVKDVSAAFSNPMEVLGPTFKPPCNHSQETFLRRQRNMFSAAEDNLTIRGVNMFGEKHWLYISDRFLPNRSGNIISHRYAKLTTMIFRAHGITVRQDGSLPPLKKITMIRDVDPHQLVRLQPVPEPSHASIRKWSIEEDLALLNAAKVLGTMWAEISNRVLPHRDRGHLRKRYQVLERRIKATCSRDEKHRRNWRSRREKSLKITDALKKPDSKEAAKAPPKKAKPAAAKPNRMHNYIMPALQHFAASLPPNYSMSPPGPAMQMQPPPHHQPPPPYGWMPYGPNPFLPAGTPPRGPMQQQQQPQGFMYPMQQMQSPQMQSLQMPPQARTPGGGEIGDNSLAAVEKLIADDGGGEHTNKSGSLFSGVMKMAGGTATTEAEQNDGPNNNNNKEQRPATPPCYYPPASPSATMATFAPGEISRFFGSSPMEDINADQLEAASALSALSRSPALKKAAAPAATKPTKPARSLFSLVTGGSAAKTKGAKPTNGQPAAKRKKTSH